jgi:hypothetical protein
MKIIVIGRNVSLAILNQMNENDQKIIDKKIAVYVLTILFNLLPVYKILFSGVANLYLKKLIFKRFCRGCS